MTKLKKIALSVGGAVTALQISALSAYAQINKVPINVGSGYFNDMGTFINSLLKIVMIIAALLVFLYLIWGGIEWITSGGDKTKTEGARNKITSAIIGLIVLAASYAILVLALKFIGIEGGLQGVFDTF